MLAKIRCYAVTLPSIGTELAVGGAASTKMRSNTRKLPNTLIAAKIQ